MSLDVIMTPLAGYRQREKQQKQREQQLQMHKRILEGLPIELILSVYKYAVFNRCLSTTEFFTLISNMFNNNYSSLDEPFKELCMLLVEQSELEIRRSEISLRHRGLKVLLNPMPIRLISLEKEFIGFVELLLKSTVKFFKITVLYLIPANENPYLIQLIQLCCIESHFIDDAQKLKLENGKTILDSLNNHNYYQLSKVLKSLNIFIDNTTDLKYLKYLPDLECLTVTLKVFSTSDFRKYNFIHIERWANDQGLPIRKHKKLTVKIIFGRKDSPLISLVGTLTDLLEYKALDLEIHLKAHERSTFEPIYPLKKYVVSFENDDESVTDFEMINGLNSLETLSFKVDRTMSCLNNKNIQHLIINNSYTYFPIDQIMNVEYLKSLDFICTSDDFSYLVRLKQLTLRVETSVNFKYIFLPINLVSVELIFALKTSVEMPIIGNKNQLKYLRFVIIGLSNSRLTKIQQNQLQRLIYSLPSSVSKLRVTCWKPIPAEQSLLDFGSLHNLQQLQLRVEFCSNESPRVRFPDSMDYLVLPTPINEFKGTFPCKLRLLYITLSNQSLDEVFEKHIRSLRYLSSLTVKVGLIKDIDLENLLTDYITSFALVLEDYDEYAYHYFTKDSKKIEIKLPFQSHHNLNDLRITSWLRNRIVLTGHIDKDDSFRLLLNPPQSFIWRTDNIELNEMGSVPFPLEGFPIVQIPPI